MFASWSSVGLVFKQLSACLGLVERQTYHNSTYIRYAGQPFILVWNKIFLCWFRRGLGFKIIGFWTFVFNLSNLNICFSSRKYINTKNPFLCLFIGMYNNDSDILEIDFKY